MDSQWPRYWVFLQAAPGEPYHEVGSVHAPDGELALLNARDVFVRRPDCSGLWVAPDSATLSLSMEAFLAEEPPQPGDPSGPAGDQEFRVFAKLKNAGLYELVAQIRAGSAREALRQAASRLAGRRVYAWRVVPAAVVRANDPAEADSLFAPARSKNFRLSSDFRTVTAMRQIRKAGASPEAGKEAGDESAG